MTNKNEIELLKEALTRIESLKNKLKNYEQMEHEPLAIIGLNCKFPGGVNSPLDYWRLIISGQDAIKEVPFSRWDINDFYDENPDMPGKMYNRGGGFLTQDITGFDAA